MHSDKLRHFYIKGVRSLGVWASGVKFSLDSKGILYMRFDQCGNTQSSGLVQCALYDDLPYLKELLRVRNMYHLQPTASVLKFDVEDSSKYLQASSIIRTAIFPTPKQSTVFCRQFSIDSKGTCRLISMDDNLAISLHPSRRFFDLECCFPVPSDPNSKIFKQSDKFPFHYYHFKVHSTVSVQQCPTYLRNVLKMLVQLSIEEEKKVPHTIRNHIDVPSHFVPDRTFTRSELVAYQTGYFTVELPNWTHLDNTVDEVYTYKEGATLVTLGDMLLDIKYGDNVLSVDFASNEYVLFTIDHINPFSYKVFNSSEALTLLTSSLVTGMFDVAKRAVTIFNSDTLWLDKLAAFVTYVPPKREPDSQFDTPQPGMFRGIFKGYELIVRPKDSICTILFYDSESISFALNSQDALYYKDEISAVLEYASRMARELKAVDDVAEIITKKEVEDKVLTVSESPQLVSSSVRISELREHVPLRLSRPTGTKEISFENADKERKLRALDLLKRM
ncbi:hypothetical protein PCE1_000326 [Barthelona sp. PCE]